MGRRRVARLAIGALAAAAELPISALAQHDDLDDVGAATASPDELVIYANIEEDQGAELIRASSHATPASKCATEGSCLNSCDDRFLEDVAANRRTADLIWSSAMDLQMKLVNDGYAQTDVSPEAEALPSWAIWANQAYGVTAEPAVIAFNKQKLPRDEFPRVMRS